MIRRLILLAAAVVLTCMSALAAPDDIKCSGVLVGEDGEPIIGATITVPGTSIVGTTDIDGRFTLNVPKGKDIHVNYIGYKPLNIKAAADLGEITMAIESQMLQDVVVTQSIARTRRTPVAVSAVDAATLDMKLGNQELPEVLKTTPGVWATKDGGGFGDAKINIRGFKSSNTATMVNGVPVNDMEWGGIYWSNWSGLGDVISSMQVQRGLGATIISSPSFGGTINMITKGLDAKKGGTAWYGLGNDNSMNYGISFSTGLMKNGWALTFLGSRKTGDGYIQGTEFEQYNYFLNISKRINDKNQISLTVTGAPQTHYKRNSNDGLSIEEWQTVGNYMPKGQAYRYNPTYGFGLNGERKSSQYNVYNKPVMMLNHVWQINHKSSLSSVLYASIGSGYGSSGQGAQIGTGTSTYYSYWYGSSNGKLNWNTIEDNGVTYSLRHGNGMFAYDQIQLMNQNSTKGSLMVMSNSVNNHKWFGGVSNYKNELTDNLSITAGVDVRYYYGEHTNEISDLYNGAYFIDYYRSASNNLRTFANEADKLAYQNKKLGVGDVVYRDWDSRIWQEGVYAQAEYQAFDKKLNLVLAGAANLNTYTRYENFYANEADKKSPSKTFFAGNVKAGANYNIDRNNNVFVNGGYITRAPYLQYGVFVSPANSNAINPNPKNEKVEAVEVGYEYHSPKFTAQLNGYYTMWKDRTLIATGTLEYENDRYTATMNGVDSRYMGLELNFVYKPTKWFELSGMFAYADNTWQNDPVGYYYNSQGQALASLGSRNEPAAITTPFAEDHIYATINQKGIKVGGSAQTTGAIGVQFKPFKGFRIGGDWLCNARNYSDFKLSNSSNSTAIDYKKPLQIQKPWEIPFGNQLDLNASYNFPVTDGVRCTFSANVYNAFNNYYIMDAYTDHSTVGTWQNAYQVFYSYGRTFNLRVKLNF
ncbi:MAG: TonB-dependent receptor [Duncaniella sp.]|uniref:TonB-dependent receptor n=1 Tax=Duncaniella sp. TaxID=2518496 RepID=UPI0019C62DC8|nr:TonB-dependent receptor plug domain-containing protein [Duncaniella sp.]MBD5314489.1 TonB-dependent receptor [Bacteroides sp.]MDE6089660.1 TonB-dependent receptor [Duncaniella sp.]